MRPERSWRVVFGLPVPERGKTVQTEHRAEAERLALLPVADQREIIALYRSVANGRGVPKRERQAGLERAAALERLLKLKAPNRKKG